MTWVEKEFMREQVQQGRNVDMLKSIFDAQHELDSYVFEKHADKLPKDLTEWVKQYIHCIEDELSEIRGEIPWKHWKAPTEIDVPKLQEEVIDVWHFLIALSQRVGLTPEKVHEVYMTKREENFKRQRGESTEKDYRDGGEK